MRDLQKSERNTIRVQDAISGSEIELYYRTPTTKEMVEYQRLLVKRVQGKTIYDAVNARLTMGLKILTGFREGDFGFDGKPISSDPASPNYREDWKELLAESASDIITAFAFAVFEGVRVNPETDIEIGGIEDTPPLPKS
jgi:hypothetical protein